jgi:hypothetical protein
MYICIVHVCAIDAVYVCMGVVLLYVYVFVCCMLVYIVHLRVDAYVCVVCMYDVCVKFFGVGCDM